MRWIRGNEFSFQMAKGAVGYFTLIGGNIQHPAGGVPEGVREVSYSECGDSSDRGTRIVQEVADPFVPKPDEESGYEDSERRKDSLNGITFFIGLSLFGALIIYGERRR
jgi:hypothetical protein